MHGRALSTPNYESTKEIHTVRRSIALVFLSILLLIKFQSLNTCLTQSSEIAGDEINRGVYSRFLTTDIASD